MTFLSDSSDAQGAVYSVFIVFSNLESHAEGRQAILTAMSVQLWFTNSQIN